MRSELERLKVAMLHLAVDSVPGSYARGDRVMKVNIRDGDAHAIGAMGRVLGVMPESVEGEFGYFVEWDDMPGIPVFTRGSKLGKP